MTQLTEPPNTQVKKKLAPIWSAKLYLLAAIVTTRLQGAILYILRDAHHSISQIRYTDPQYELN